MKRRVAREKALQALFQIDMSDVEPEEALTNVVDGEEVDAFLKDIVFGFVKNQETIDGKIRTNLEKWSFDRLAKVDRNILRIGTYELLFVEDVPNKVVINEAVEIAKTFGDDQSSKFVNGVLSKISQS
ncbi:transcription antitermination factor NusB [Rossellomorea oryzaecorticis]|jgi:transcription antitermination protein NusB|uniref:Transcription antitermination protein NusB n=1 Tax=Rossellomorea oryzaecorticis TaxID=1396505 RepID=A0ABW8VRG0_9BACI|nr:transcription antitermination factor NusB [Bacillus sp. MKU004]QWC21623.1 transcription antitermination factor NusB [Bacillus haikouensis]